MPEGTPAPATFSGAALLAGLINRCQSIRELHQIHTQIITLPHLSRRAATSLLSRLLFFCATTPSTSNLSYASNLFQSILSPTLFDFNAFIRTQSSSSIPSRCPLSIYIQMLAGGIHPDHLTLPFLLKFCSLQPGPIAGQSLHGHVVKLGFQDDIYIQNTMVLMYCSCRIISSAHKLFDRMPKRDLVSKNSLLTGYLRSGELDAALNLFSGMEEKNVRTWNSIITGLVHGGQARKALNLFQEMQFAGSESIKPDKITIASVISACSFLGALDQGKWLHSYLRRNSLDFDVVIQTALVDMYGKCGSLADAQQVFGEMPEKDVFSWTAMISALAVHGSGDEASLIFDQMVGLGFSPNHVTFGALLVAFAHSGSVEKGRFYFAVMKRVYSLEPQLHHYASMIDLLGRAGLFSEAETLIESMPMEPDSFVWGALLGACRMHGNVDLGERIADHMIRLDPLNHAFYIVLSDIYANARRYECVKRIRNLMKGKGVKKASPGCSMIEVDGRVCEFSLKGTAEELLKEIEWVLDGINGILRSPNCGKFCYYDGMFQ
ncbi:Pentatricopeptide repeat-containing protein [Platanthera guangdongensis]|uniref:Pentatricopeptide repeat-containing protein n=1 Tax=Platanthera guangdongensis TaxID=2320717 RepID=A0ABR2LNY1_9ASPA